MDDFDAKNRILDLQREANMIRLANQMQEGQRVFPLAAFRLVFAVTTLMFCIRLLQ